MSRRLLTFALTLALLAALSAPVRADDDAVMSIPTPVEEIRVEWITGVLEGIHARHDVARSRVRVFGWCVFAAFTTRDDVRHRYVECAG